MPRRRAHRTATIATAAVLALTGCGSGPAAQPEPDPSSQVERLVPEVLAEIPHDPAAFTQGFEVDGPTLLEGTGIAGSSQLRELDPATGELLRSAPVPDGAFGEGITLVDAPGGPRVWQLTWRDGVAYEWDRDTFAVLREVPVDGEGWGLCADGDRLVRSDGTARLRFHDPATFAETGGVDVTLDGQPVADLNELECVDGQVWANVWRTERILRIDPADGAVTAVVDAAGLLPAAERAGTDVFNGIASLGDGEYLVTGKYWPTTFRVRFVPA